MNHLNLRFALVFLLGAWANPGSACEGLLSALNELEVDTASAEWDDATYFQLCTSKSTSRDWTGNVSIPTKIGPIGIGGSGSKKSVEDYCRTEQDRRSGAARSSRIRKTPSSVALSAYLQCVEYSTDAIKYDGQYLGLGKLSLTVTTAPGQSVSLDGIETSVDEDLGDGKAVVCETRSSKEIVPIGRAADIPFTGSLTVTCTRPTLASDDGIKRYPAASVQLILSPSRTAPTFGWPAANLPPLRTAEAMDRALLEIQSNLNRIDVQTGSIVMQAKGTRALLDTSMCPKGTAGLRGDLGGRVDFERPFDIAPRVIVALSTFDVRPGEVGDTNRLAVGVTAVDEKGFNYSFSTWCRTMVNGASATWIAASR